MMRALMRISGMEKMKFLSNDIAQMCISNEQAFLGIFATHPPIKERISTISRITNTPIPQIDKISRTVDKNLLTNKDSKQNPWIIKDRPLRPNYKSRKDL